MSEVVSVKRAAPSLPPQWLWGVLIALMVVRWIVSGLSGLAEDEAYYRLWSTNLQTGYFDHAPFVAYAIRVGTMIFGDTNFGVRFFGPPAMLVASLAIWRMLRLCSNEAIAATGAIWFNLAPIIIGTAVVITPDTPLILFWTLTLWAISERIHSGSQNWWLLAGLFAGLALQSKYTALFLGAGIVLLMISTAALRRDFLRWQIWVAGALAMAIFAPVVIWNAQNEWMSFIKQMGRAERLGGYDPRYFPEWLGALLLIFHPLIVVLAGFRVWRWWRAVPRQADAMFLLPVLTSLPFLLYMLYHSQFDRVQANWPAPLLAGVLLLALPGLQGLDARDIRSRISRFVTPLGAAVALLLYGLVLSPVGFSSGRLDRTNETRGWPVFMDDLARLAQENQAAWLGTIHYGVNGQLVFEAKKQALSLPIFQINDRFRYRFLPPLDADLLKKPGLVLSYEGDGARAALRETFETFMPVGPIGRGSNGSAEAYFLYRVEGLTAKGLATLRPGENP